MVTHPEQYLHQLAFSWLQDHLWWVVALLGFCLFLGGLLLLRQERALHGGLRGGLSDDPLWEPAIHTFLQDQAEKSGYTEVMDFLKDTPTFESAVEKHIRQGKRETFDLIEKARARFQLRINNPGMDLVSTRQLFEGLSLQLIVSSAPGEVLDAPCQIAQIDEEQLTLQLPVDHAALGVLREHRQALLVYYRSSVGEVIFPLSLRVGEHPNLFFASHCLLASLSPNAPRPGSTPHIPLHFTYVGPSQLEARKRGTSLRQAIHGEGQVLHLETRAMRFLALPEVDEGSLPRQPNRHLAVSGLAQIAFSLQNQALRLMLDVLRVTPRIDGSFLIDGSFRPMTPMQRAQILGFLHMRHFQPPLADATPSPQKLPTETRASSSVS